MSKLEILINEAMDKEPSNEIKELVGEISLWIENRMMKKVMKLYWLVRQEERERAGKIIEEIPIDMICELEDNCDCGDLLNCKWTKGHNYARGESRYWIEKWKQEALNKLNETV